MECNGFTRNTTSTVTRCHTHQVNTHANFYFHFRVIIFHSAQTDFNCLTLSHQFYNRPTEREETEKIIRTALKEIIVQLDLDEVTSKYIRTRLEEYLDMNLTEYKSFIDEEMLKILKQLDAPTKIFDHVYLGSEWNASNLEELQKNGYVSHISTDARPKFHTKSQFY